MKNIAALLILISMSAHATDVEVDIGIARYLDGHDDFWYQSELPHSLHMMAPAFAIRTNSDLWRPNDDFALRSDIGWNYLGSVGIDSLAMADGDYFNRNKFMKEQAHLSDFHGTGHDNGFNFSLEPTYQNFSINAGLYYHLNTWSEYITDWGNDQARPVNGARDYASTTQRWIFGTTIGASITEGSFVLRYEYFKNPSHFAGSDVNVENFPAAWHGAHVLTVGYKF
jgi:hypothetical protein